MIERINLVPQKPLAERVKAALPLVLGSLMGLIVLLSAIEYGLVASRIAAADHALTTLTDQKALTDQLQGRTQDLRNRIAGQRQQLAALQTAVAGLSIDAPKGRSYATALARITSYLPDSVRCTRIAFDGGDGQLTGEAVHYNDLPELVTRLKSDPLFKSAAIKEIDKNTAGTWHQFAFTIQLGLR